MTRHKELVAEVLESRFDQVCSHKIVYSDVPDVLYDMCVVLWLVLPQVQ